MIVLDYDFKGKILDVGGGGEGFIGRAYGAQVVAIDRSQEELDEAPDAFEKVLMDATNLEYEACHFDNVTFFYSLMYMTCKEQEMAICEAVRVLKNNGVLAVWDCNIASAYPDPFCVDVDVSIGGSLYHTTYGIIKKGCQSQSTVTSLCAAAGLHLIDSSSVGEHFHLYYRK